MNDLDGGVVATHRVDRHPDPAVLRGRPDGAQVHRGQDAESLDFVFGSNTWRPP